ncbi:MAG: TerD family protein [Intestinibacter sp.]
MYIDLDKLDSRVQKSLYMQIYLNFDLVKDFSDVKDAYIRVVNRDTGKEIWNMACEMGLSILLI